jgi:multidrug efflux pump subunit AcrA (membrane-fusion protein)
VVAYPGAEIKVGVERAGRVVRVRVQEGDAVKKGDLLAEIESEELRAGLAESRARVHEAEAELRMAELNLDRRQKLVDQGIVAVHDRDQATRDIDIARARRETALRDRRPLRGPDPQELRARPHNGARDRAADRRRPDHGSR